MKQYALLSFYSYSKNGTRFVTEATYDLIKDFDSLVYEIKTLVKNQEWFEIRYSD